jgi:hypothetical protein
MEDFFIFSNDGAMSTKQNFSGCLLDWGLGRVS